jgi:hypothetical protein
MLCVCISVFGCNDAREESLRDSAIDAYTEIVILHESYKNSDSSMTHEKYLKRIDAITDRNGISTEELRTYMEGLSQSTTDLKAFYQSVKERLEEQRAKNFEGNDQ